MFLQQTCPIHNFRSETHVLDGFVPFCCPTRPIAKICIGGHLMHEFVPLEPFLVFLQQTCAIHYFRSKAHVFDGFMPFCCRTRPASKISIGVHLKHEFVPRKPFLVWSQQHSQSTTLGLKLRFTILLDTSMHFYVAFVDS